MSQILNGRGVSASFDSDGVRLDLRRRRVDIPLAAVREVRTAEDRVVEIVLTDGATHRVEGGNPTATAAFVAALTAELPRRRDPAGSALVTTTEYGGNADAWAALAMIAALPLAYVGYVVWVGVTHGTRVVAVIVGTLPLVFGLGVLFLTVQEAFRRIVLARRGITVLAQAVGKDGKKNVVYEYVDAEGRVHKYSCRRKAQRTQLAYDPHKPERAAHAMWPPFAVLKLLTFFIGSLFWLYVGGYLSFGLLW
ncbi:DUF3592 domain-containing protein [Streptomyces sp. NK08204]|uniref:DUF3592 domain-containing protein n=1 Tax=Streptomyces sp. NK08204 TaxID=2873260 RepID=UPI001CED309D|nr:DUF3592 domain-containing protein [Streptomyces sp. NK08204]